jgi:predicted ATPase/transcriptional regulator with XRE-family HTH domain
MLRQRRKIEMQDIREPFSALLRRYRRAAGLSQEELASRAGLSAAAISTLERGRRATPRPETLQLLASVLGLTAEQRATFVASVYQEPAAAILAPVPGTVPTAYAACAPDDGGTSARGERAVEAAVAVTADGAATARAPAALPVAPTPLLGREQEMAGISHLLQRAPVRLLTLTGPGGVGKTRLALQVATGLAPSFRDGACWVSLATLADPALLGSTVLQALGGAEAAQSTAEEALLRLVRSRELLLVLDNFEQLLPEVGLVVRLLSACRGLVLLVTSRASLRVRGEQEYAVAPLAVPRGAEGARAERVLQYPAAGLFVQRAQAVTPSFVLTDALAPSVAELCRRLDGLPLALELAAARVKVLGVEALLGRLSDRLGLLTEGARDLPSRQRTLRAAIGWSEELLAGGERRLFRRLGVFAGGCTLEAAQAICGEAGADMLGELSALVDQSLLQSVAGEGEEEPRFVLLETIREYALAQLAAQGELAAMRERHLAWCVALAEQAASALPGPDQPSWLRRLEDELDNLRSGLSYARERGAGEACLRLAGALWRFWLTRGYFQEGRAWLEAALAEGPGAPPAVRARALNGAGNLASRQGDYERATALHEETLALHRALGERQGIAGSLSSLGVVASRQGRYERAAALLTESMAIWRSLGDRRGMANALSDLGWVAQARGEYGNAAELLGQALALYGELADPWGIAYVQGSLGWVGYLQGEYGGAAALLEEALARYRQLDDRWGIANVLVNLGWVAQARGDHGRAAALYEESAVLYRALGDRRSLANALVNRGWVAQARGDHGQAATMLGESLQLSQEIGATDVLAEALEALAWVEAAEGRLPRAARLGGAAEALREALGVRLPPALHAGHERAVQEMRARLGEEAYAAGWAAGRALPVQKILAEALTADAPVA